MTGDKHAILRAVANERGGRVRTIREYDPNVCQFTVDAAHEWKPFATEGYPFSHELRFSHEGRKVTVSENQDWFRLKVEGDLDVGVCSINKSDAVGVMDKSNTRVGDDSRWDVFVPAGTLPTNGLKSFLKSLKLRDAVGQLLGSDPVDSSLHIFKGAILLYTRPCSSQDIADEIEVLSSLVGPFGH
jgi:hypothetical protein